MSHCIELKAKRHASWTLCADLGSSVASCLSFRDIIMLWHTNHTLRAQLLPCARNWLWGASAIRTLKSDSDLWPHIARVETTRDPSEPCLHRCPALVELCIWSLGNWDHLLRQQLLPQQLTTLRLQDAFGDWPATKNSPALPCIKIDSLPTTLTSLDCHTLPVILSNFQLPHLTSLRAHLGVWRAVEDHNALPLLHTLALHMQSFNALAGVRWPAGLHRLDLHSADPSVRLLPGTLPPSLRILTVRVKSLSQLLPGSIPDSVVCLHLEHDMTQSLPLAVLPAALERLSFSGRANLSFELLPWPQKLTHLSFGFTLKLKLGLKFAAEQAWQGDVLEAPTRRELWLSSCMKYTHSKYFFRLLANLNAKRDKGPVWTLHTCVDSVSQSRIICGPPVICCNTAAAGDCSGQ